MGSCARCLGLISAQWRAVKKIFFNQEMEMIRCILEILEAERGWIGGVQEVAGRASGSCGIFTHLLAPSVLLEGSHCVLRPQGNPRERSSRPAPTGGRGPQLETAGCRLLTHRASRTYTKAVQMKKGGLIVIFLRHGLTSLPYHRLHPVTALTALLPGGGLPTKPWKWVEREGAHPG